MSSKRHACNCYDCVPARTAKQELQHGGTDWETDYDELLPYRKHKGKNYRRRSRACKKSKAGEACNFTLRKVLYSYNYIDPQGKTRTSETAVMTCERCGKYGQHSYIRY